MNSIEYKKELLRIGRATLVYVVPPNFIEILSNSFPFNARQCELFYTFNISSNN